MTLWVLISTVSHGIMAAEPMQELPTGDPVVSRCFGDPSGFQLPGVVHTTLSSQSIPKEIFAKIQENIEREALFRKGRDIGVDKNIAQFSIFFSDSSGSKVIDFPVPRLFFCGTQLVMFQGISKQSPGPFNAVHEYPIGTESERKQTFQVMQRNQPDVNGARNTLESVLHCIVDTGCWYEEIARRKFEEIRAACDRCQGIREYIGRDLQVPAPKETDSLRAKWIESLTRRNKMIMDSLEKYDLSFNLVPWHDKDPFIEKIKEEIGGGRTQLQDVFLSKFINLACSEQLIVDTLDSNVYGVLLRHMKGRLPERIILHIHTTKAPCKACILKVLHNLEQQGRIREFFKDFPKATIHAIISYEEPYQDNVTLLPETSKDNAGYGFFISDESQYGLDLSRQKKRSRIDHKIKVFIVHAKK